MNVGSIAEMVGISESAISHHLRSLRQLRLVRADRHSIPSQPYASTDVIRRELPVLPSASRARTWSSGPVAPANRSSSWSMSSRMTSDLVVKALLMAVLLRRPPKGLIFHSDRGSQYCSHVVRRWAQRYGIRQSMSRKGDCWITRLRSHSSRR